MNEFWNWYLGLFSDADNKVRLAVWTATIGTVTFLLTFGGRPLFMYIKRKRGKIKIDAGISHQVVTSAVGTAMGAPLLTCTVTNHDDKPLYIQNPMIKLSESVNGNKTFVVPMQRGTFPMKLDSGQQTQLDFDSVSLYNQLLRHISTNGHICFVVSTTTGKKYESKKLNRKDITGHINVAANFNK